MKKIVLITATCTLGLAALALALSAARRPPTWSNVPAPRPTYNPDTLPRTIAFYEWKVNQDSQGAIARQKLGSLYLQKSRQTGDISDILRAEKLTRQSLAIRHNHNDPAFITLTQALLAEHRFHDALISATSAVRASHGNPFAARLRVDCLMELGQYATARRELTAANAQDPKDPGNMILMARWYQLTGCTQKALDLARLVTALVDTDLDLPHENVAWYHVRVGDLLAQLGQADAAIAAYSTAVNLYPYDYKALMGAARVEAGREHWSSALSWATRAAAVIPAPEALAMVEDADHGLGRSAEEINERKLIEEIASFSAKAGAVYDRQRALYCADHGIHLDVALKLARKEIMARQDILSWDTLAWCCYKAGKVPEAHGCALRALAQGTADALLLAHAGFIAAAANHPAQAAEWLNRALGLNPGFNARLAKQARVVLGGLRSTADVTLRASRPITPLDQS